MLEFKHLEFVEQGPFSAVRRRARLFFENGYGVSVIQGGISRSLEPETFEVAVLKDGDLCYTTPITDDVVGFASRFLVTEIMVQLQNLEGGGVK